MAGTGRAIAWAVLAVLLAAAAYEAAIALELVSLGDEPGEEPAGRGLLLAAALLALLAAALLCAVWASRPNLPGDSLVALIDLAAAAFLLARFHSFDAYFAPTLRRFSEGGAVAAPWVYALVALALLAAAAARTRPRVRLGLSIPLLPLIAVTAFATGLGH